MHVSREVTITRLLLIQGTCHFDASHYRSLPQITCKTFTVYKLRSTGLEEKKAECEVTVSIVLCTQDTAS